jgi:hypothetical protein
MTAAIARALTWLIRFVDRACGLPACRECGCTDHAACAGGCFWAEPTLCSACDTDELLLDGLGRVAS